MTHTNHRYHSEPEENNDFVIMAMPARGLNDGEPAASKLKLILDIFIQNGAINGGGVKSGLLYSEGVEKVKEGITGSTPMLHGVFDNVDSVKSVIQELKEKDLGISIIVSGPIPVVRQLAFESGVTPHSIAMAAGILGNTSLLPPDPLMELTTMCGHGLVHRNLINYLVKQVVKGKQSIDGAVSELTNQCVCGILNPRRARRILKQLVQQGVEE